jgi:hypothetical protein
MEVTAGARTRARAAVSFASPWCGYKPELHGGAGGCITAAKEHFRGATT